jgi:hypothetical protein
MELIYTELTSQTIWKGIKMKQNKCVTITNLSTGEERTFSLTIEEALISANEYDKGNRNTWLYPTPDKVAFQRGQHNTVSLGNWCGFDTPN